MPFSLISFSLSLSLLFACVQLCSTPFCDNDSDSDSDNDSDSDSDSDNSQNIITIIIIIS